MIYYLIWIMLAILTITGISNQKYNKAISFLMMLILTLFAGLRNYDRWSDGIMYHNIFVKHTNVSHDIEFGFKYFTKICSYVFNYNIYLCLIYAIVFYLYYRGFKDYSKKYTPFCLFVITSTMLLSSGGMRQYIAGGILFFSIKYIKEKQFLKFACIVASAFLFHRTAIVFIVAYFIPYIKMTIKQILIITVVGIMLNVMGVFEKLLILTYPIWGGISSLALRINLYQTTLADSSIISLGFFKRLLIIIMVLLFYDIKKIYLNRENDSFYVYWNIYIFGYLFMLFIPGTFSRINVYFYTTEAFLEVLLIKNATKNKLILLIVFMILNGLIWVNTLNSFYPELFFPYRLCF